MADNPHSNGGFSTLSGTPPLLDRDARARLRGARTKRLNRRLKPLDDLDAEVKAVQEAVDSGAADRNVARVVLQALALRKDIQLAKQRVIEVERKLEEFDVKEEFEDLKRALGLD